MRIRWLILICALCLLVACATADREAAAPREAADMGYSAALARSGAIAAPAAVVNAPALSVQTANTPKAAARKVHHEGSIRLRATQPQRAIDQAVQWTRAAGGYVESLTSQNLVLQIPAERFRSVYDQVLGLGEVLAKSLSARDVTEEFLDVELRLSQAKATRERLLALIQRAGSQNEKLRLLREVERLSKEIELMEARMARLRTLVAYSRLSLGVESRKALDGPASQELRGFDWINSTGASRRGADRDAARFSLATPAGMVELGDAPMWSAASPDGVTLQTQQRRNDPKGSTAFWLEALRWRLKDRFAQVEQRTAGEFAVLRAVSVEEPRFIFWIAVTARDDKLFVAQAYFSTEDRERRYETPITNSLRGGVK
jgi:hypothetical protein